MTGGSALCDMSSVEAAVGEELADGRSARAAQMTVSLSGEYLLQRAWGDDALGRPVTNDTVFAVYCAAKPVIAMGVAALVTDGELSLADRLGNLVEPALPEPLAQLTLAALLNHTAGIHVVPGVQYVLAGAGGRESLVRDQRPPRGWDPSRQAGYSEAVAWHLVGRAIETVASEPLGPFIERRVLDPLDVADIYVCADRPTFLGFASRIGVNESLRGSEPSPLLLERTPLFGAAWNPGFGSYSSATGLESFYRGVLAASAGAVPEFDPAIVTTFVTDQTGLRDDAILHRPCSYGFGFMTRLSSHFFGRSAAETSFGHSGNVGMTCAFADPEVDLVAAIHFTGLIDGDTSVMYRRPRLVESIYRAIQAVI